MLQARGPKHRRCRAFATEDMMLPKIMFIGEPDMLGAPIFSLAAPLELGLS